nr:LysE family transporter [Campylobacter estrildidarum]
MFGVGGFLAKNKIFSIILAIVGLIFTLVYAFLCFKSALSKNNSIGESLENPNSLKKVVLLCLAFTYLNPHAYLDTVVLIGAASLSYNFNEKIFLL